MKGDEEIQIEFSSYAKAAILRQKSADVGWIRMFYLSEKDMNDI